MIQIETDRIMIARARVNRRVRWPYAEYCGRWKTVEEAVEHVREYAAGRRAEYQIENMMSGEIVTGFVG